MSEFSFLNTFFNIIARNEQAYMRCLFQDYSYFAQFKQWLKDNTSYITELDYIDNEEFRIVRTHIKSNEIDILLHINFTKAIEEFACIYDNRIQVLNIPNIDESLDYHLNINNSKIDYWELNDVFSEDDLSFLDPFPAFFKAIQNAEKWGGILIFNNQENAFYPLHNNNDLKYLNNKLNTLDNLFFNNHDDSDLYILQLSDLHLGRDKTTKGLNRLRISLDELIPKLESNYPLEILITGDLMESPNRRNMYLANDFMNELKKKYKADVTFILGNHDMIVHGFNLLRRQKSKVIAYLLGEHIKVLEKQKIIFIKIDTTSEGNLARGKVGNRQLNEIDDELEAISNLQDYTLIAMLHHHVYPIDKAQFLKTKWHEKTFINNIIETSKALIDADILIEWLNKRNIKYVLHGHKHLPFFRYIEGKYIISGGSSTGGLKESKSKYISYNLIKYDVDNQRMKNCLIFYDDKAKSDCQRVEVYLFRGDD